ncbi:zinc finger CW-type PWWP domain protein 1-like [Schistocerca cancellata]|uniref:zinc finger CW-type PWWP domain protein 1-like n=1 Tax=Schistocerca cancellata TaxID=274614 RepID=UPI002118BB6C|nr:zinc finger CW-type PWWP domain protein 1-like [Schistocerca cancellata]
MPFKSLTDAEYEDIFKAAIGDCYEVESSFVGDICKSLAYKGINNRKTVEDEVVTPKENEALTPGETAKHECHTLVTRTQNVSEKPKKVKLFSAPEIIGQKKIIPVFKSKPKTKIQDHPENNATKKSPEKGKEKDNPEQGHENAKSGKKIRRDDSLDYCKTTSKNKESPQKGKEKDNLEQKHQNDKSGKKIRRDNFLDHCKETSKNEDLDETCYATSTEKASPIKLDKESSEPTVTVLKGNKNVNKNKMPSKTSGSSLIKLGKKTSEMNSTVHKGRNNVNKDRMQSGTNSSATMKSTSQTRKTSKKPKLSNSTKEMEPSGDADELSPKCQSSNKTTTPAPSGEVLSKERPCKLTLSSNSKIDSESSHLVSSQQETPLSQPPAQYSLKRRLKWLQVRREVGVWVQCCNESCSKWRYLDSTRDPQQVPRKWFCNMNQDKSLASCTAPQKGPSIMQELDLIENEYTAGSVVWARLAGYPWWPAMVDDDPDVEQYYWITTLSDIPTHYNVVFFDEKPPTRAWITPKNLRPFSGHESGRQYKVTVHRGIDYSKRLAVAKAQATEALEMDFKHRLQKFSFLARFKGPFVMNTRSALSNTHVSHSQEEFEDNDDMIQLLKEVKHRRKHSLATSISLSQKRLKISENTICKNTGKNRSEATTIPLQNNTKSKDNKAKEAGEECSMSKYLNSCKQPSETNTSSRLWNKKITDREDTSNKKAQDKTKGQNNEELPCMKDIHNEEKQDQCQSTDDDDETVMSEDMFAEDDSTQFESVHEITDSKSSSLKQDEHPQGTPVIKPEDNQDPASSGKILINLVAMACTIDEQESKSSVNIQKKGEPEQVTGDSTQIPSSVQAIVGTDGGEETASSCKAETRCHNEQSSSLPSTSDSYRRSGCKVEYSNVVRKGSPSQSLNNSTHASSSTDEIQEQLSSHVSNNTDACSVLNVGEGSELVAAIPEVPLTDYPDDAVVPQGFSPLSRESSPDFEVEE